MWKPLVPWDPATARSPFPRAKGGDSSHSLPCSSDTYRTCPLCSVVNDPPLPGGCSHSPAPAFSGGWAWLSPRSRDEKTPRLLGDSSVALAPAACVGARSTRFPSSAEPLDRFGIVNVLDYTRVRSPCQGPRASFLALGSCGSSDKNTSERGVPLGVRALPAGAACTPLGGPGRGGSLAGPDQIVNARIIRPHSCGVKDFFAAAGVLNRGRNGSDGSS